MGRYSIRDLEQLSGVKAHTIRVWEQRYNIVVAKRTQTNIRYYDDDDLRLLLNISFLNRNNYRISQIAKMQPEEINEKVRSISESNLEFPNQIDALVISMVELDERRFEKIISTNTLQFGFEKAMLNIVYPFLRQIGILWQTGNINPAHEHFISNLIRQKLIVAIDGQLPPQDPAAEKYLLFLPEGELHELTLLFAAYILKSRYNRVIYMGQSLPLKDLISVGEVYQPDYLFTIVTSSPSRGDLLSYLKKLQKNYPDAHLVISGYQAISQIENIPSEIRVLTSLEEMIAFADEKQEQVPVSRSAYTG